MKKTCSMISVAEAAERAGVSRKSIYRWLEQNLIRVNEDIVITKHINGVCLEDVIAQRDKERPKGGRPPGSTS